MPRALLPYFLIAVLVGCSHCADVAPPGAEPTTETTDAGSERLPLEILQEPSRPEPPDERQETTQPDNGLEVAPTEPSSDGAEPSSPEPDTASLDGADASEPAPDLSPPSERTELQPEPSLPEPRPEPPPEPTRPACIGAQGQDLCDDGDDCNGRERCNRTTGKCIKPAAPTCPTAPSECNQPGGTTPKANAMTAATPIAGFRLRDQQLWSKYQTIVDQVSQHASVRKVTMSDILKDLNRTATRVTSVAGVSCLARGFKWNSGDTAVSYWYPQGLAGSATATSDGRYDGKQVLIASWYHKPANDNSTSTNKGVRISVVDVTSSSALRYRHILLVEPVMSGSRPNYKPVAIHAGGLVWVGRYLYVPDTSKGFRVFDMNRILRVQVADKGKVGYDTSTKQYQGFGYRYVLPQVNAYTRCPGSCCVRFSFASLNVATKPYSLLSGEYTSKDQRGRLHRWPLDPKTGRLQTTHRTVQATEVLYGGTRKMQGAAMIGQRFWISSSQPKATSPTSPGSLVLGQRGQSRKLYRYPYPPEDMHYMPQTGELWSHTENPNKRYVFAIKPTNRGGSCP